MLRLHDDRKRELVFARPPLRVVSLVPSDTHTLFALGVGDRVVGRTDYCVEPADRVAAVPSVGGTKSVDVDAVLELGPDVVIANQEENARPALERLAQRGVAVYVSFPRRVADGVAHLGKLARMFRVDREPAVVELVRRGYQRVRDATAAAAAARTPPVPTFLPIWADPLMTIHADTFASDMLALAGARNVFADRERLYPLAADLGRRAPQDPGDRDTRYPRVTLDEVRARAPSLVLLPDEPHEFTPADAARFEPLGVPIRFCSGKDLFWYGAWSIDALPRLTSLIAAILP